MRLNWLLEYGEWEIEEVSQYKVVVKVNLEYVFDVENEEEAVVEAENVELPNEYVEDSFEIVKVMKEEK